jgi:predicted transcriptional regulator
VDPSASFIAPQTSIHTAAQAGALGGTINSNSELVLDPSSNDPYFGAMGPASQTARLKVVDCPNVDFSVGMAYFPTNSSSLS